MIFEIKGGIHIPILVRNRAPELMIDKPQCDYHKDTCAHFIDMGCDSRAAIAGITTHKAFPVSDNLRLTLKVDGSSSEKATPVSAIRVAASIRP